MRNYLTAIALSVALLATSAFAEGETTAACASGQTLPTAQVVQTLRDHNPADTQYVLSGEEFKEFMRAAAALKGKSLPEALFNVMNNAVITDGPGAPSGASVLLFQDTCLMDKIFLTSDEFKQVLEASVPNAKPVPSVTPSDFERATGIHVPLLNARTA